ncbi:hypothetical protein BB558_003082 [Smittium angustum]|uniref:Peptidase S1 domain-containing protein n=1 Tax=Smittium angustum TaxID=133377 RepID=A0A2U1J769_SMIAN|nr:hypothetical protein BB558_003082 [Smittium angustum]
MTNSNDATISGGNTYSAQTIIPHPKWILQSPYENDIAIVKTSSCITGNGVAPAEIYTGLFSQDENLSQYAYGITDKNGTKYSGLQEIQTVFGGYSTCTISHSVSAISGDIVCTKINPKANICFGDSGGPLVRAIDGNVIGIASQVLTDTSQKNCTAENSIGIFTRFTNFMDFFIANDIICTNSTCKTSDNCGATSSSSILSHTESSTTGDSDTDIHMTFIEDSESSTDLESTASADSKDSTDVASTASTGSGNKDSSVASACTMSLFSGSKTFTSAGGYKKYNLDNAISVPCKENAFELTFDVASSSDFYAQMLLKNSSGTAKKMIETQIGLSSGRNFITKGTYSINKRQAGSSSESTSESVSLIYTNGLLYFRAGTQILMYTNVAADFVSSFNFIPFSGSGTISNAVLKCINDKGC